MSTFDDSPSLEQLVASASEGDEEARFELHRRFNALVCFLALKILRRKGCDAVADHSEEIIGSAWLAILENVGQLKHSEKIERWICKIILNLVRRHVAGAKGCISNQNNRVSLEMAEVARIEQAEKVCQNAVLANEIRARAHAKSTKLALVMRLYIEEDYTMDEVAEQLGESASKLSSMYYRGLSDLRKYFKDDDGPSER